MCKEHAEDGMVEDWDSGVSGGGPRKKQRTATEADIGVPCKYCNNDASITHTCKDCKNSMQTKDLHVKHFLLKHCTIKTFVHDKTIDDGCSKRRPDLRWDLPTQVIIVEVDEHQHKSYSEICECARNSQIVGDVGGRPVRFIRYNPDTVRHAGEIKKVDALERLSYLLEVLEDAIARPPLGFCVKLTQLYYDIEAGVDWTPRRDEDITTLVAC